MYINKAAVKLKVESLVYVEYLENSLVKVDGKQAVNNTITIPMHKRHTCCAHSFAPQQTHAQLKQTKPVHKLLIMHDSLQ